MNERMQRAVRIVRSRALQYECSFSIAWTLWMDEDEQEGFTYAQVAKHLKAGR